MVRRILRLMRDTAVQYPAVISGYLIYMYYFLVTMDFYKNIKTHFLSSNEFLTHFDALLWMWLLAYALVKVIGYREKVHLHEQLLLIQEHQAREAEWRCDRYETLTSELKTEVNEPIAIATGYVRLIQQQHHDGNGISSKLDAIDSQLRKVIKGLDGFYSRFKSVNA